MNKTKFDRFGHDPEFISKIISENGFYGVTGVWNSIMTFPFDNHLYRGRVETIIVKNNREVFVKKKPNGEYFLPGGSKEKDVPDIIQATNECQEEARINIRNIEATGISYKVIHKPPHSMKVNDKMVYWDASYTDIYVAQYDSLYKGEIEKVDKDPFILSGKFYPVKQCLKFFKDEHREALIWYLKNNIGENEVIAESASIYEENINKFIKNRIRTPDDLSQWMKNNIRYANFNKLKSAEEVYKTRSGSCHDQVIFEKYVFNKLHIKCDCLFMIESDGNQGGATHSLLYFIKDKKYYWFENAWENYSGITGPYQTLDDLKNDIKSKWQYNPKYPEFNITTMKNVKTGMSLQKFVTACCTEPEEQVIKETAKELGHKIFYLSSKNCDGHMLVPKIPNNYLTQNNFEDSKTRRVCFYTVLMGAVMALPKREKGLELYVHEAFNNSIKYYVPSTDEVPDCKVTHEVWVKQPIKVKCVGKIELDGAFNEQGRKFTYGKNNEKSAEHYRWKFHWLETYGKPGVADKNDDYSDASKFMKQKLKRMDKDTKEYVPYVDKNNREHVTYEMASSAKKRNIIDSEMYGIPKLRKYPLNDKKHVLYAIRLFNRVDKKHEEELAKNIIKAMQKFGISSSSVGERNRLIQYLKIDKNRTELDAVYNAGKELSNQISNRYKEDNKNAIKEISLYLNGLSDIGNNLLDLSKKISDKDIASKYKNIQQKKINDDIKDIISKYQWCVSYVNEIKLCKNNSEVQDKLMMFNKYLDDYKKIQKKYKRNIVNLKSLIPKSTDEFQSARMKALTRYITMLYTNIIVKIVKDLTDICEP
jgi:hypothetical protein